MTKKEFEDLKERLYKSTRRTNALNRIFRRETGLDYVLPILLDEREERDSGA